MATPFLFKTLFIIALLSGYGGFPLKSSSVHDELAPEIAPADIHISLRDTPDLEKAFIDSSPAHRIGTVPVGKLGVDGGNADMIVKLAQEIATKKYGRYDSLLIAHKGKLLFESYYWRGRINLPHGQASATKAYLSLAIGRAIQLGYLTMEDLDKPVVSFLKDLDPSKFVEGAQSITLHKAMTMSSGLRMSWEKRDELREQYPNKFKGQGQVQAYLKHSPPITPQTQTFDYKFTDPSMVMQVLHAVVPGSAKDFIKTELLDQLGITTYGWETDFSGLPTGNFGARMTSRDMIKWGTFVMNKGKWKGEQLIPESFIAKSTHKLIQPNQDIFFVAENVINPGYGYYWWQADLKVGNKSYLSRSAQGGGGQYIILVDELDLIVVATGHLLAKDPDREVTTLQLVAERILPAFIQ